MPKHILVAHDLSVEADVAVRRAAQLARQHGAQVSLLHVIGEHFPAPRLAKVREAAAAALQDSARNAGLTNGQHLFREGHAATLIVECATQLGADLLVVGAHHQQLLERFDGTTLEQIVRHCPVPALLAVEADPQPYRRALSALDFSVGACNAWHKACDLLPADAKLLSIQAYAAGGDSGKLESRLEEQRKLLEQLLHDESTRLASPPPRLACRVSASPVREALERTLADWQPQLLVLGSSSRGLLEQALLGGTTRYYLRHPPCDVLISA